MSAATTQTGQAYQLNSDYSFQVPSLSASVTKNRGRLKFLPLLPLKLFSVWP